MAGLVLLCSLLLSACATSPAPPTASLVHCQALYEALDQTDDSPTAWARIEGFPYLRVDRFLASYRHEPLDQAALRAWLERLAALDRQARLIEHAGLLPDQFDTCARHWLNHDLHQPERLAQLRQQAVVAPDYSTVKRVVGLYPLLALPVRLGIKRWHEDTRAVFAQPLNALPVTGELRRYQPPERLPLSTALPDRDALGVPNPTVAQQQALFARYAPVFEIDVAGQYDLPGRPYWRSDGLPTVAGDEPVVYRYLSYTRWQGEALLQLNYLIWFAERPLTGPSDLYGGPLDGLIWRVTLATDGTPLMYDTLHACGCYHLFFPGPALRLRPDAQNLPEPPLLPQPAPQPTAHERLVIRIASGTHYVQRVYADHSAPGITYGWRDYADLYQTPTAGGGTRSLFDDQGLIAGTERHERWLLWPMGIASAGAMRERGRHATAFVGRRHFDDADLLESLFYEQAGLLNRPERIPQ